MSENEVHLVEEDIRRVKQKPFRVGWDQALTKETSAVGNLTSLALVISVSSSGGHPPCGDYF